MIFSSIYFIFIFLPIVFLVYFLVPPIFKNIVLFISSIFFYAWGEPIYIILMLFSIVFNFMMGIDIDSHRGNMHYQKLNLIFTIIVDLFILGFFKYYGFLVDTINQLIHTNISYKQLSLPIGISFYTFQTLSYVIDVYRGKVKAQRNIINFGLYVSMFPQLIAGPIVRYIDIEKQLINRKITVVTIGQGMEYFIKGMSKKVLLANNIGALATEISSLSASNTSSLTAILGVIAYSMQIYFDFSGYSDMAIGLGKMFGFTFMKNFDYPYTSKSITEFWRRWHISLGTWFREYVYIPLGGNRVGVKKHIRNIFIVWFATGLWHGASWNFVLWGLFFGVLLLIEKYFFLEKLKNLPSIVAHIYTLVCVNISWIFFENTSLRQIGHVFKMIFGMGNGLIDMRTLYYIKTNLLLFMICFLCCSPFLYQIFKKIALKNRYIGLVINIALFIISCAYLVYDTYNPFLYFRF
ncbi:MAG: MBOAT family O-acyltransferase [Lachnospiraceae bacterium]